ncbi:MAG: electron transport complex subunit RsxC, partial [Candidatus Marinimicrobia bacterium]|nr:electron transport complex subunit RsxC [Candidatus Neomarinimicrobiota bacterium]
MRLQTFKKGIHPAEFKSLCENKSLERLPLPKEVFIPLNQHIGAPCKSIVERNTEVKTGQMIGASSGFVSSTIHASISGKVKAIDNFPNPLGVQGQMIHIISDGNDDWIEKDSSNADWDKLGKDDLLEIILNAGIVGMGGAAFPTHVKLNPPKSKKIDTLIINGCECEPYLTADHRVMLEQDDELILGIRILMKVLGVSRAIIGIENNKPDAIEIMVKSTAAFEGISVMPLKVKYPQGAEKMLIKAVLNRKVPADGLPMDVGVIVNNVGTAIAVAEAVTKRKPLIERVVSITGDGIREPKNVIARIGTPFQDLIDFCSGLVDETVKVIMGGPMMGLTQYSLQVPVVKATSGILCLTDSSVVKDNIYPCILCGTCVNTCPMDLLPTHLAKLSEKEMYETSEDFGILSCCECGSCAFVCPSNIPLVQWIRIGKMRVNELQRKQKEEE